MRHAQKVLDCQYDRPRRTRRSRACALRRSAVEPRCTTIGGQVQGGATGVTHGAGWCTRRFKHLRWARNSALPASYGFDLLNIGQKDVLMRVETGFLLHRRSSCGTMKHREVCRSGTDDLVATRSGVSAPIKSEDREV